MSIRKFLLVTTALMGLYGASSAFATMMWEDEKEKVKIAQEWATNELFFDFEKSAVKIKGQSSLSYKEVGEYLRFQPVYKNQLDAYNNSWKGFFMNNVVSASKYVGKVFGGLFY